MKFFISISPISLSFLLLPLDTWNNNPRIKISTRFYPRRANLWPGRTEAPLLKNGKGNKIYGERVSQGKEPNLKIDSLSPSFRSSPCQLLGSTPTLVNSLNIWNSECVRSIENRNENAENVDNWGKQQRSTQPNYGRPALSSWSITPVAFDIESGIANPD